MGTMFDDLRMRRAPTRSLLLAASLAAPALVGCGESSDGSPATSTALAPVPTGSVSSSASPTDCLVRLHGKGGTGQAPYATTDAAGVDVLIVSPTGNADGWGGRQWLYFPDDEYTAALAIVDDAIDGCERVIVNGFSNGAAFAAALYCRGETFDDRLVRVVIDDPVVDRAVTDCAPSPDVGVALYWTGALDGQSQPGTDCADADWTCEGGTTIGLDAYAAELGTTPLESPFTDHEWYLDAPELSRW